MFSKDFNTYINDISGQYEFIKKFSKPLNSLCGIKLEDITDLSYQDLKHNVPDLFRQSLFEDAMLIILKTYNKGVSLKRIKKESNSNKLRFLLWIKLQYEKISSMENNYLHTPPDSKLLQAGIKDLDILEDINLIDTLAGGNVLKWDAVRSLPYSTIFNKQLKNCIESKINKRLVEINKQK